MSSNLTLYEFELAFRNRIRAMLKRASKSDEPMRMEALPFEKRNAIRLIRKGWLSPVDMERWTKEEVGAHGQA